MMAVAFPASLPWIDEGMRHRGLQEIKGTRHNATITKWLIALKAWWTDDETPWCGVFIAHCLQAAGLPRPANWFRAKSYETFGQACALSDIPFGAICTKTRSGGGHVFFAVGRSADGNTIYGLGGNQSDSVNIVGFPRSAITAARWPDVTVGKTALPVTNALALNAARAGSEA